MPKYLAIHVVVLAGLVLAVTFLVFQSRALTFRVQALEAARPSLEAPLKPVVKHDPAAQPTESLTHRGEPMNQPLEAPSSTKEPSAKVVDPKAIPDVIELTPAQEEAVAKSVDRILKEKYGHLPKIPNPQDLEKTLEKELNLSESQKLRIGEILKWKRAEHRKLFEGEDPTLGSTMKKAMDIDKKAEAAIKNELDATQQAKYDQLKKDGKIPQGVVVQIEANDGPEKN